MIDILMQLADIGSTVTVVITKKEENYLISVTPKIPNQQLQPVLISGTKEDVLADFPNLLKGMGEMRKHVSNLASINEKLEKKVVEKTAPTAETAKAKTGGKKGPLKVGSGTAAAPSTDLFGTAAASEKDDNDALNEELDEEEAIIDDVAEGEAEIAQSEPEVVESPKPEPEPELKKAPPIESPKQDEEEDIF